MCLYAKTKFVAEGRLEDTYGAWLLSGKNIVKLDGTVLRKLPGCPTWKSAEGWLPRAMRRQCFLAYC